MPSKVRTLKPLIATVRPMLASTYDVRDTAYTATPWRQWYKSARWQRLRLEVFARDLYTCQRTGLICAGKHPAPDSPVANHKVPHRGDPRLFWDSNNIETVSKAVHDSLIQAEERAADATA